MKKLLLVAIVFPIFFACNNTSSNLPTEGEPTIVETEEIAIEMMKDGITITGNSNATVYPDAFLALNNFIEEESKVGMNTFEYEVSGYDLAAQTEDNTATMCANSGKGQHIHFILNNAPYKAHYESTFEAEIPNEGHHVLLSFLSRSYHMSIKNGTAHELLEFNTGGGEYEDNFDETAPHLFYSRPKGTYTGTDAKKIMLDFFLVNTDLRDKGYSVRLGINNTEFMLKEWIPYFIEGLPMGENKIMLELLDENGLPVESPFNPVERTFILADE